MSNNNIYSNEVVFCNLKVDINKKKFFVDSKEVKLPKKEFKIIKLLISNPEKVFERKEIFDVVWGNDVIVGERTLDVHIRKLRKKIGGDYIRTIKGVGYALV
ncbi:MAG TPA: winged helix family transcriptional regulator [Flavobacteriaceae bacterium]|nr:winged helix family transcriptional regulator [Flavobacteriaceae bacterium]